MKIIRVSGENLASLQNFDIDFETDMNASLFALVGDTGAGKSTILDAICLALYSKVPRFAGSGKSDSYTLDGGQTFAKLHDPANILSRGAKNGFAEVEFMGLGGKRFMARTDIVAEKSKFVLKHTLKSQNSCDQWIEEEDPKKEPDPKKERKLEIGEGAVGLNWQQFSKVIILPQGDFKAFLSASNEVKTNILENLTNTEVYEMIGKRVDERIKEARAATSDDKVTEVKLAGEILSEEELIRLQELKQNIARQKADLDETRSRAAKAVSTAQELAGARAAVRTAQKELESALAEKVRNAEAFRRAELYGRTVNCRESFRDFKTRKKKVADFRESEVGLKENVTSSREKEQQAANLKEQADEECQKRLADQENSQEDLKKAEELEANLTALGGEFKGKKDQVAEGERNSAEAGKKLAGLETEKSHLQDQLKTLDSRHEENKRFGFLLEGGFEKVTGIAQRIRDYRDGSAKQQALRETCWRRHKDLQAAIAKDSGQMAALREKWHVPDDPEGELFWNRCPEVLKGARDSAQGLRDHARAMGAPLKDFADGIDGLSVCLDDIAKTKRELAIYDGGSGDPSVKAGELVRSLEEELGRLNVMLEFSSHVLSLRKGEPCPCCGATKHPRIDGLSQEELETMDSRLKGEVEEKKKELGEAKGAQKKAEDRKKELESTLKSLQKDRDRLKKSMVKWRSDLETVREGFLQGLDEMTRHQRILGEGVTPRDFPCWEKLAADIAQAAEMLKVCSAVSDPEGLCGSQDAGNTLKSLAGLERVITNGLTAAGTNWDSLKNDAGQYTGLRENVRKSREDVGVREAELKEMDAELSRLGGELREQETAAECLEPGARELLGQLTAAADSAFKKESTKLQKILEELQNYGRQRDELEKRSALKDQEVQQAKQVKTSRDSDLQKFREELQDIADKQNRCREQHRGIFGGVNSGEKSKMLQDAVDSARKRAVRAENELISARKDRESAEKSLEALNVKIRDATAEAESAEKLYEDKVSECLRENPGLDRDELEKILALSEDAYHEAAKTVSSLTNRIAACEGRTEVANIQMEKRKVEHEEAVAQLPTEACDSGTGSVRESFLTELNQRQDRLDEDFIAVSHSLETDREKREELASCRRRIEEAEDAIRGFRSLQELFQKVGGLKNYAQSINFQCLLENANRYIRAFTSGRYDLFRVSTRKNQNSNDVMKSSMEMLVTDHLGADEARSVGSLSGGEQFCVSLGLALGLSDLVTGNVTVGTMFVDEGFDTLDNTYLDNVLNCMQSAKINRQIGIISHVSAIVDGEMIPQKIYVERDPNNPSASTVRCCGAGADSKSKS